jgi:KUP system potassium uptake protein
MEYKVTEIAANDVLRITFRLGFRVEQRLNLYFRRAIEELVSNQEVDITSRYESLSKQHVTGDFRFVVLEKFLSVENELPLVERVVMQAYFYLKQFIASEVQYFGLDTSSVKVEKVPLIISAPQNVSLTRIY